MFYLWRYKSYCIKPLILINLYSTINTLLLPLHIYYYINIHAKTFKYALSTFTKMHFFIHQTFKDNPKNIHKPQFSIAGRDYISNQRKRIFECCFFVSVSKHLLPTNQPQTMKPSWDDGFWPVYGYVCV